MSIKNKTIIALATPFGKSAIGIIRISGIKVQYIIKKILHKKIKPRYATLTNFYNKKKQIIDKGIALFFKSPYSFTGEDILELHSHGGPIVINNIINSITCYGIDYAKPGEFSKRAFLNKKSDLITLEAIADLINSETNLSAQCSLQSLIGTFSKKIKYISRKIIKLRSLCETSINFIEFKDNKKIETKIIDKCKNLILKINNTIKTAKKGSIIKKGINIAIIGEPNTGKSSLINYFSKEEIAIVSNIPGTTRDIIKNEIQLHGLTLNFIDTAGLQKTSNIIEKKGIKKAKHEILNSNLILIMVNINKKNINYIKKITKKYNINNKKKHILILNNKCDLLDKIPQYTKIHKYKILHISIKKKINIEKIEEYIKKIFNTNINTDNQFMARQRHIFYLKKTIINIKNGIKEYKLTKYIDILNENLIKANNNLFKITGEKYNKKIINKIFSKFCIGK